MIPEGIITLGWEHFKTAAGADSLIGFLRRQSWRTRGAYHEPAMPMKVREVVRLLEQNGWIEMRSKGSHRNFKHPNRAQVVTVPGNQGKELAPGR